MNTQTNDIPRAADISVSEFANWYGTKATHQKKILDFFRAVTEGYSTSAVEVIRKVRKVGKASADYNKYKAQLPAFTISYAGETREAGECNGCLCIDIDGKENAFWANRWEEVRDLLGRLPFVYFSSLSAGGNGVFAVLAIDPAADFTATYADATAFFAALGFALDQTCTNITRLRVLSYDPRAVMKHPSVRFTRGLCARFANGLAKRFGLAPKPRDKPTPPKPRDAPPAPKLAGDAAAEGAGWISKATIDRVKSEANIKFVFEQYSIPLTKKGKKYLAICPFHDDGHPSMQVYPEENYCKCFSCGDKAMKPIDFVMRYRCLDFPRAVREVAAMCNIPIEETAPPRDQAAADFAGIEL